MIPKLKKGNLTWDEIGKLLIFIVVLIVILVIVWIFKDKLLSLLDKFKTLLLGGLR
jgi:hypothetical protein